MRENLYNQKSANITRLKTDKFFTDDKNTYRFFGFMDDFMSFIEDFQLLDEKLWDRFVNQFREGNADSFDAGWRCEFWGKAMRGASFLYSYTKNPKLYSVLKKSVIDMIECQKSDGRISTYDTEHEFDGWDMWGRKYVLLGMQYFLEICTDDLLNEKIISCMKNQVDYIINHIGKASDGKKEITFATRHWRGLNACSILEPIVRLYNITEDKKYIDFAEYIVDCGGTDVENIFRLAYENKLYPYQYPVTKAYEMISCFEGLLEYYRATGIEWHKTAIINFADKILEADFTIIGSAGCTHELFDHSTVRQANTTNGKIQQETCVTVTLMKFFYQLNLLTGDSKYADAFEVSLYNAYLGAINTDKVIEPTIARNHTDWKLEPLPFDSYSPLTAGTRGNGIGGLKLMSDNHYYGCCACIGAAGLGLIPKTAVLTTKKGFAVNLYIDGNVGIITPNNQEAVIKISTQYPKFGNIKLSFELPKDEEFEILLRNPSWSHNTIIHINGDIYNSDSGYIKINRKWSSDDIIEIDLDMKTQVIYPIPYGHQILMNKVIWGHNYMVPTYDEEDPIAKNHIALRRGPIILAQDNRLGYSVDIPTEIKISGDRVDVLVPDVDTAPYRHITEVCVPLSNGDFMTLTDYASAGKTWSEESKMAAWILTK